MKLPNTYTSKNETGCCAVPNVDALDKKEFEFKDKHFIRDHTRSFLYMPLNMNKVMKRLNETAEKSGASMPATEAMILSRDLSPWKAEQLYAVTKPLEGANNVTLNGSFVTMVFEGPYQDAKKWYATLEEYVKRRGKKQKATYMFYTTCPKCAKHYGKNYTIALTQTA